MNEVVYFGSDHIGVDLKRDLLRAVEATGRKAIDVGAFTSERCDYPSYAEEVCSRLATDPDAFGVLVCGSGVGMQIAANRYRHVRAALLGTAEIAAMSRQHNNANVACFGARYVDAEHARQLLELFLAHEFEGGRHETRVDMLSSLGARLEQDEVS